MCCDRPPSAIQRRTPAFDEQGKTLATLTESQYTNAILEDDAYRTPLPAEVKTYELTAPDARRARSRWISPRSTRSPTAASEIAYEAQPTAGQAQQAPASSQLRTLYRKDDLSASLPLGAGRIPGASRRELQAGAHAGPARHLPGQGVTPPTSPRSSPGPKAQYRDLDGDGRLWIPSGQAFYSPTPGDRAPQELAFAQAHFFLPHRYSGSVRQQHHRRL